MRTVFKRLFVLLLLFLIPAFAVDVAANYTSNESFVLVADNQSSNESTNTSLQVTQANDNIKDLIEVPETNESPFDLKTQAIDEMTALDASELTEIIEHLKLSVENSFWDGYHIKSGYVFEEDKKAAQKMRMLLDSEKSFDTEDVLLECLVMLLQADRKTADVAVEDAKNILLYISEENVTKEISSEIEDAKMEYAKAQTHLQDGDPVVSIEFFRKAWEHANEAISIADRNTIPRVNLSSPVNGSFTNVPLHIIAGTVEDVALYTIKNATLMVNGIASEIAISEGKLSQEAMLAEGANIILVKVNDTFGNSGTAETSITLDTIPPEITIAGVENGDYYNRDVLPEINISDVDLLQYSVILDGTVFSGAPITEEGEHVLEVYATDLAGNTAYVNVKFTIDKTPPEVEITKPSNNGYLRQTVEINGTAMDTNLENISLRIDGSEVSAFLPYLWNTTAYEDGNHTIELYASDKSGNNASDLITVTVDNTPPSVRLTSPTNNSYLHRAVSIEGSATDSNLNRTSLSINGEEVTPSLPYLWDTAAYPDGTYTLRLSAWDRAGNPASIDVEVTVDNTPPVVSILSPVEGALLRQTVEINSTITEINIHSISMMIDGIAVASSILYLWETSAYPDGDHRIELNVSDRAGNDATAGINVTTDNTPPVLAVSELSLNPVLNTEYSLLITSESGAAVDVNSEPIALENGSGIYRKNITLGVNNFTVTALDPAGNPSVWKKTMLVDEDTLPDWYEVNVTGTDPLDGDSDSSLTPADEADNDIKDDMEDFDSDRLSNREEFAYGLDPFKSDTEGDGLNDWYELRVTGTNPLLLDSDDNGVNDQDEDKDGDSLNNLMEQEYNTNPLSNDTDEDDLSDYREIMELGTDPLKKDTDNDFLDDSIELKPFFNTDPNNPDTNNNGIPDGNETYEQSIGNKTLGIEVVINASDNREDTFVFEDAGKLALDSDVFIGKPINILAKEKFSKIKIKMYYDESRITNESDLAMFYFDKVNHSMLLLEKQGVNKEENYIWAETDHLSDFIPGYGQEHLNRFFDANAPTIPLLKAGDEVKLKARVHNVGKGEAEDVVVAFYNGDPDKGGELIGTNVTPSIGGNRSALASVNWRVNFDHSMNIFVKIDPDKAITEASEDNNIAGRFLDNKSIDSDSDGLADYDEINGLRTGMSIIFFTDPKNPDTDGDGLDDGKEMGPVMNKSEGRYYYLFSYPSRYAEGAAITNSNDSDGDGLSDKDEYDFSSSGLDMDTDGDKLDDFDEWQLGTLPNDPDTDRDGLTDWWETKADASVNKYGHTDPKNRDSDYDGAIDGGESNMYPGESIDVNGDGVDDSGKEMDLNGDGIIEMGEENYYETPPNNVTYFFDIFAVADQEYRDYYTPPWGDSDNYKKWINYGVDGASVYFMKNFSIKLKVVEISEDIWNSDDALPNDQLVALLKDAVDDFHWENNKRNADALLAFTGKDPDYEGMAFSDSAATQIPELSDPRPAEYVGYYRYFLGIFISDNYIQNFWTHRLVQHEVSHLFGAYDYGLENPNYHTQDNVTGERLARIPGIMDKTKPSEDKEGFDADPAGNIWFSDEWNIESILIINANKTYVTNGSYKKII